MGFQHNHTRKASLFAACMALIMQVGILPCAAAAESSGNADDAGKDCLCLSASAKTGGIPDGVLPTQSEMQTPEMSGQQDRSVLPYAQLQCYEVDSFDETVGISLRGVTDGEYDLSSSEWSDDGSDYYFSLLDTGEKTLYLKLKQAADAYMTGTADFETTTVKRDDGETVIYILPCVSYSGITTEQMKQTVTCFIAENPQYYFMRSAIVYSESAQSVSVGLYAQFADGAERAAYTDAFRSQLEQWESGFDRDGTTVELETQIHQCILDNVDYNDNASVLDADDVQMSQSCISGVLFDHATVCTGYAKLFSLLCRRSGIECVMVTSAGHAWNKVRMGSVWYNVDCTWNDSRGDGRFLNVTDEQLSAEDTEAMEHTPESQWDGFAPACTVDFDADMANGADTGANVTAPAKPEGLTVVSQDAKKISVSFEPAEGSDGYTVQYASDSALTVSKKKNIQKTSCSILGLVSGKSYYVRVRAFVLDGNGGRVYGDYCKKQKVTVK